MLRLAESERGCAVELALLVAELVEVERALGVVLGVVHDDVAANAALLVARRAVRVTA